MNILSSFTELHLILNLYNLLWNTKYYVLKNFPHNESEWVGGYYNEMGNRADKLQNGKRAP